MVAHHERLQCGHAHSLAIDRVEAAHRVAHDKKAGRKAVQPFVAVPGAGWEVEADRLIKRFGVADRLVDIGETKRPGEIEKALGVDGRVVTENSGQGQHPPIALQRKESTGTRKLRRGRVQDCQVTVECVGR
jgi:hypothetical protein